MKASSVAVVAVALVIGFGIGTLVFYRPVPTVTFTAVGVQVVAYSGSCVTTSGTASVVYSQYPGDQYTEVVTVHSGTLPPAYYATVTTESSVSVSYSTEPFTGPC